LGIASDADLQTTAEKISIVSETEKLISQQMNDVRNTARQIFRRGEIEAEQIGHDLLDLRNQLLTITLAVASREHAETIAALHSLLVHGTSDDVEIGASPYARILLSKVECYPDYLIIRTQKFTYKPTPVTIMDRSLFEYNGAFSFLPMNSLKVDPRSPTFSKPGDCPADMAFLGGRSSRLARNHDNMLVGARISPGCWVRALPKQGEPQKYYIQVSPDQDIGEPLHEWIDPATTGLPSDALFDQPMPTLSMLNLHHATTGWVTFALVCAVFLEMCARYLKLLSKYRIARVGANDAQQNNNESEEDDEEEEEEEDEV